MNTSLVTGPVLGLSLLCALCFPPAAAPQAGVSRPEFLVTRAQPGTRGGQLVVAQRAEPRTLNPVIAVDIASKDIIRQTIGDLVHINRDTQRTEPALAKAWTLSPDGLRYTLSLRENVRFSDGDPFDADDVVFSFQVYLDPKVASTNRDFLIIDGQPIVVRKLDRYRVEVTLAKPYAAAERMFDSIAMLPRHVLEKPYTEGRFTEMWGVSAAASTMVGLGAFRFQEYVPGQRLVLERNPHYWKADRAGTRLPYLDRLVFLFVPNEDAQTVRLQSGEADIVTRLSAANFDVLARADRQYELFDVGSSLEYTFVFFNLNDVITKALPDMTRKQAWFRRLPFRRAVSLAVDRDAVARLVYRGRATPLSGHVPPGNKLWLDRSLPRASRSLDRARALLRDAGFTWNGERTLVDETGQPVEFTIVTNSSNAQRVRIATILQDDLKQLGMRVRVVTLELRALLDRLLTTGDYDACVLSLGGGDADPNAELNVWLASGTTHLWNLRQSQPATPWEAEIDGLMRRQLTELNVGERKRLYDRVQRLVVEHLPIIPLVSPNILVGARKGLGNFRPTVLDPHALWNAEELFWRERRSGATQ
jgi:peptide/nickel transport system substrate-binding protein